MFEQQVSFSFPTSVLFGAGAVRSLPECLAEAGVKKALLVTDSKLPGTDAFARVEAVLKNARVEHCLFKDVHPNPLEKDVTAAAEQYRREGCNGIVGLGGGSAIDAAKATAVLARYDEPLSSFEAQFGGYEKIKDPLPPILAIPTTAGTGSEVGRSTVITVPDLGRKVVIFSPRVLPVRAILDPELTIGLPPHLTAATGMDAFTHHLESYTSTEFHPVCDAIALGGLELVVRHLERAVGNGSDIEARGYMLIASMMGAIAFQKELGAAHSLAHPLSAEFDMHHGLANAVCLPAVMRFNAEAVPGHYARAADLFGVPVHSMTEAEAAAKAAGEVSALNARIGLPARLRDCGIPREALPGLAKKAVEDGCHKTNPRPCSESDLLRLYEESW